MLLIFLSITIIYSVQIVGCGVVGKVHVQNELFIYLFRDFVLHNSLQVFVRF